MGKKKLISDIDGVKLFDDKSSIQREFETKTPSGNKMAGRWVYRNSNGELLDFDLYINDIASRFSIDLYANS